MRFKLVPEPPADLGFVADAQRAVPLVPGSEDDCCARLMRRTDVGTRDDARTWLTFLRALGLAGETDRGFERRRVDPTPERLREALCDRVLLAPETLAALRATEPATVADVFAAVREEVPAYERHKNPDTWAAVWRDRVGDLLGWFALLDLAERVGGDGGEGGDPRYRATDLADEFDV